MEMFGSEGSKLELNGRVPAGRPVVSKTAAASKQPHNQQQDDGTDCRIDNLGDQTGPQMDAQPGKEQAREKRTSDTDKNVADDSKAGAADYLSRQPSSDKPDKKNNKNTFVRHSHHKFSFTWVTPPASSLTESPDCHGGFFRFAETFN
jgi:hypothetical protein